MNGYQVTGLQLVIGIVCVVVVALAALLAGMWFGYGRGFEEGKTEAELEQQRQDAFRRRPSQRRQLLAEVAHETDRWEAGKQPAGFIAVPDWRDETRVDDLDAWSVRAFADMDQFMANLLAAAEVPRELVLRMSSPQTAELTRDA